MKILYLDTSSDFLYTGIVESNKLICEIKKEFGQNISEVSMIEISEMFKKNKILPTDINKIIVVNGPGSFTGIRVGVTIAKTYAWSLNIPIITISSMEAMAISTNTNKYKIPILDARRDFVYAAIFDSNDNIVYNINHILLSNILAISKELKDFEFISNDVFNKVSITKYNPDILKIVEKVKNKEETNPHAVNPNYYKKTEAEEKENA